MTWWTSFGRRSSSRSAADRFAHCSTPDLVHLARELVTELLERRGLAVDTILVHHMIDLIESEYADVITIRALSARLNLKPAYLGRLFRQEVGASVRDYLTRVRLEHAGALIRNGAKIEAVALSVGYRSKKNFYRQFRKRYGTTPVPYRSNLHVV